MVGEWERLRQEREDLRRRGKDHFSGVGNWIVGAVMLIGLVGTVLLALVVVVAGLAELFSG